MRAAPATLVQRILDWYRANRRELPWRDTGDPYRIWISEVMLQQTRVGTVIPYYERFLARFPDITALAAASREEVLATWVGLGYYRRARMMHDAARRVENELGGRWPPGYAGILALPGIGEYTAAAIASIAFDEPRVALDGNAFRVLARLAEERRDIRSASAKRSLAGIGGGLMQATQPGERGAFTQALMELGATVCVPRAPACPQCPWMHSCAARTAGTAADLPAKGATGAARKTALSIAVARRDGRVLVRQRPPDAGIMPGFWELPTIEGAAESLVGPGPLVSVSPRRLGRFSHAITSTQFDCRVHHATARRDPGPGYRWLADSDLGSVPLSTITRKALRVAQDPGRGQRPDPGQVAVRHS